MKRPSPGPHDRLYAFGAFLADPAKDSIGQATILRPQQLARRPVVFLRGAVRPEDDLLAFL